MSRGLDKLVEEYPVKGKVDINEEDEDLCDEYPLPGDLEEYFDEEWDEEEEDFE